MKTQFLCCTDCYLWRSSEIWRCVPTFRRMLVP